MLVDETTIILEAEGKANAMGEYMRAFKSFFQNELKDGKTLNTDKKREELRQCQDTIKFCILTHNFTTRCSCFYHIKKYTF